MCLTEVQYWFNQLKSSVGKDKIPVVRELWENKWARKALWSLLNPSITYGVGKKSLKKEVKLTAIQKYSRFFDLCDSLQGKTNVTDQDIAEIQYTLSVIPQENRELAESLLTKTATLGVTAKTVNKAIGKQVIPVFACMLAEKYFEHPHAVDGKRFTVTEKLDGIRCLAVVKIGRNPVLYSRQGQIISGLTEVEAELKEASDRLRTGFVLDGELLVTDREGIPSKEQYKRTTNIVRRDGEKKGITYNVFDYISMSAFEDQRNDVTPYHVRRCFMMGVCCSCNSRIIHPLPVLYDGNDTDMIGSCLAEQRNLDHEGVMINLNESPYEFKRTQNLLKVKVMQDCDLEIIGVQEGTGKFEGTLGSLVVDYKGNPVGVGSGLTDVMRKKIWSNPSAFIGRIATIQYFEETNDSDGKLSIRFPVFKDLREEGKEVSYH